VVAVPSGLSALVTQNLEGDRQKLARDGNPRLVHSFDIQLFDESYCSGMRLGPPEISIHGLSELAAALASFGPLAKEAQDPVLSDLRSPGSLFRRHVKPGGELSAVLKAGSITEGSDLRYSRATWQTSPFLL